MNCYIKKWKASVIIYGKQKRNQYFSKIPVGMGYHLYGYRGSARQIFTAGARVSQPIWIRAGFGADGNSDLADDLPDDDESRFSEREKCRQKPEGAVCYMGNELADKAVQYVQYRESVLLCRIQSVHHARSGDGVPCGCGAVGCGSVYCDGDSDNKLKNVVKALYLYSETANLYFGQEG